MASNFDFLKEIDSELHSIIIDSERLFRDSYFNQSVINTRIFAETLAKKMYGKNSLNNGIQMTFDDILNCLKDNIKDERQKEIIDDMFFIKQEGNKCAHGQDCESSTALEVIKRAFEMSINHCYKKNPDIDRLLFDVDLLILEKASDKKTDTLAQKYVELATLKEENDQKALEKQELLDSKEKDFKNQVKKEDFKEHFKKDYKEKNPKTADKNEKKQRIKQRIKEAKKELKNTINKNPDTKTPKTKEKTKTKSKKAPQAKKKNQSKNSKKASNNHTFAIIFYIFTVLAIYFLAKFIFFI